MNNYPENTASYTRDKPKPQVSIGMPVYNGSKFIRKALDSLLSQTYTDFELIISDNASTDDTEAICCEYAKKDARIRYIRWPINRGAVANFRFVLDQADGEYFMWAAADDMWDVNWIEKLLFVSKANQCIAFGTVQSIDEGGRVIQHPANRRKFSYNGAVVRRRAKYYLEHPILGKANPIYGIYPKSLITVDALAVLEAFPLGADALFLYKMLERTQINGLQTVCLYKRIHRECASASSRRERTGKVGVLVIVGLLKRIAGEQFYYHKAYASLANPLEKIIYWALFPFVLINSALIWLSVRHFFKK